MGREERAEFTNMCMISDEAGNVLVLDRQNPDWPGVTFPGGHVEKGESFAASVIREVKEETGLTVKNLRPCGLVNWYNDETHDRYIVHFYKTNDYEGELIKETDEGEVFFTALESLNEMTLSPNFDKYLKVFLNDDISEIYCRWNEKMKENCHGEPDWDFQYR